MIAVSGYDFAIVGSSQFAGLLAADLAGRHGRQVIQVKRTVSPQRLIRHVDLALPLAARPETWQILSNSGLSGPRVDVAVMAETEAGIAALDHLSHVAMGFGLAGRRVAHGETRVEFTFHGVATLAPTPIAPPPGLPAAEMDDARLEFGKTGAAELWLRGERLEAGQIVLADDDAILDGLPHAQWPAPLMAQPMTATLTAPIRRLPAPVMIFPDRGVTLLQRPGDSVLGLIAGDDDVEARMASTLRGPFPIPRVATSRFRRLISTDGPPVIGALKPARLWLIAGFGDAAAFFAPATARFLAGVPGADEKRWFAAHDPVTSPRDSVAEVAP